MHYSKQLLESGAHVNALAKRGRSVLAFSVAANSVDTAQVLLDHGADIEARDTSGMAPLASAVLCNALEMVSFLLDRGADIEGRTADGYTALHLAAESNLQQMSQLLIERSANMESRTTLRARDRHFGDEGLTPLLVAARHRSVDTAYILVNHGAKIEATAKGYTGLHFASMGRSKSLIRFFAQEGVLINARTLDSGDTALILASDGGNSQIVALLIKLGADVNASNNIGWTPLHFAAYGGFEQIAEILINSGANPAAASLDGQRPRDVAYGQNHHHVKTLIDGSVPVSLDAQNESKARQISSFFRTARDGHLAKNLQILDEGIDINSLDRDGRSSLSLAAENGWIDIVQTLTSRKADMNLQDNYGGTPIWWASKWGHTIVVEHLLEQGAHCDTPDADGQSPLSISSQYGHLATARMLLEHGADPNSITHYGKTPLFFAVDNGQLAAVELLLDSGADVNYRNAQVESALQLAEKKEHKRIAEALRTHPSFVKSESDEQDTDIPRTRERSYRCNSLDSISFTSVSPLISKRHDLLLEASRKGNLAMIKRLIKAGADQGLPINSQCALDEAAASGQSEAAATLIEHGANVNGYANYRSPLVSAASAGQSTVIKLLCSLGASVNSGHEWGDSALMHAAEHGHEAAASLLLAEGAKTETRDSYGRGPLWHATNKRFGNLAKLLVENGANLECADLSGCTPLMVAVQRGDRKITQFLLEKGSQMRPDSKKNYSPLCYAAKNGDEAIVELLLDHGADVNFTSDGKRTALHIATTERHTMVMKMLIEAGADVFMRDTDGRTALSLAKESSNDTAIRLLCQSNSLRHSHRSEGKKAEEENTKEKSLYQYHPLTMENSIRIVRLYPGSPGDILSFELEEFPLVRTTSFEALSYEWQEKVGIIPVLCDDKKILVTPNCKAAMEKLRLRTKSRYIWIDAICINQADDQERNQQVAIMADIFRAADKVIMWLGEETDFMSAAFEALPLVAKAQRRLLQEAGELNDNGEPWEGDEDPRTLLQRMSNNTYIRDTFENLMDRTYWTRAWILPEIIIAGSRGVVMCGDQSCDWTTLKFGMPLYRFCGFGTAPLVFNSSLADEFETKGKLTFANAVYLLHALDATDLRDKVFAALGLSSSDKKLVERPVANYTMSVQQVYVHAARYIIDSDGLSWAWGLGMQHSTKQVSGLPSWVPDFKRRPADAEVAPFEYRLVSCQLDIVEAPVTTDTSLQIGGCIVDRVVFKLKLTKDLEISTILSLAAEALGNRQQSIYDLYPVGDGFDINSTKEERQKQTQSIGSLRKSTNAGALFDTIFRLDSLPHSSDDGMTADRAFILLIGYLAWTIYRDVDTLEQSRTVPDYVKRATDRWFEESIDAEAFIDFEIDNLTLMEDLLRYNKDLIYTENGYFGLTNHGEAEDGLSIALVGKDSTFRLLRKKENHNPYYEYVDVVFLNFMGEEIDKPEKAYKNINRERLEFR